MTLGSVQSFQAVLEAALVLRFGQGQVKKEWASLSGEDSVYSARIDVAVGPFATGPRRLGTSFIDLLSAHRQLVDRLISCHRENVARLRPGDEVPSVETIASRNPNARCFLAIEIENECFRKHILGGLVNAGALGKIGIVVAWTPEKVRAVLRMRRYLLFLASVGKKGFDPSNLLILAPDQLRRALAESAR